MSSADYWYGLIDQEYEFIVKFIQNPIQTTNWLLSRGDKRTEDWFLMQSYTPTWLLVLLYLVSIFVGKRLMKNREAFNLRWILVIYNFGLVFLNAYIVYECVTCSWRLNYNYLCQLVNYSYHPDEMRIASALWWYYISKCIEFLDTIFFVLRKKNNQISFLHVYHHATMFPMWWIGVKYVAGGMSMVGSSINSFIHVVMYTYYGLSALGPGMQKYLWWKKYLTRLQLGQFMLDMCHGGAAIYTGCKFHRWILYGCTLYATVIMAFFINFYHHAYVKAVRKRAKTTSIATKEITQANGVVSKEEKAKSNGVANNEEIPQSNGELSNGNVLSYNDSKKER